MHERSSYPEDALLFVEPIRLPQIAGIPHPVIQELNSVLTRARERKELTSRTVVSLCHWLLESRGVNVSDYRNIIETVCEYADLPAPKTFKRKSLPDVAPAPTLPNQVFIKRQQETTWVTVGLLVPDAYDIEQSRLRVSDWEVEYARRDFNDRLQERLACIVSGRNASKKTGRRRALVDATFDMVIDEQPIEQVSIPEPIQEVAVSMIDPKVEDQPIVSLSAPIEMPPLRLDAAAVSALWKILTQLKERRKMDAAHVRKACEAVFRAYKIDGVPLDEVVNTLVDELLLDPTVVESVRVPNSPGAQKVEARLDLSSDAIQQIEREFLHPPEQSADEHHWRVRESLPNEQVARCAAPHLQRGQLEHPEIALRSDGRFRMSHAEFLQYIGMIPTTVSQRVGDSTSTKVTFVADSSVLVAESDATVDLLEPDEDSVDPVPVIAETSDVPPIASVNAESPSSSAEGDDGTDEYDDADQFDDVDYSALGINPVEATMAKPGTEEKVLMLAARYDAGQPLWHDKDCYDHGLGERMKMASRSGGHHINNK